MLAGPSNLASTAVRQSNRTISRPAFHPLPFPSSHPSPLRSRNFTTTAVLSFRSSLAQNAAGRIGAPRDALGEAQDQIAKMKRKPALVGLSMDMQTVMLQDVFVLPPVREIGIARIGGMGKLVPYIWQRMRRWGRTFQSLAGLRKLPNAITEFLPERKYNGIWNNPVFRFFVQITPTGSTAGMRDILTDVYVRYNEAQARGDHQSLSKLAAGKALKLAESRSPSSSSSSSSRSTQTTRAQTLEWKLEQMLSQPKLVQFRVFPVDQSATMLIAQAVMRFESEQSLTIHNRGQREQAKSTTQTSRVKEYYAFERSVSGPMSRWKIKEKVQPFTGGNFSPIS